MRDFDFQAPTTLTDALKLLAQADGQARCLAGGTDLIDQMRVGRKTPSLVIDTKRIPELNRFEFVEGEGLHIGAAVSCARIYEDPVVKQVYPMLAYCCSIIGDVKIQNRATVGGNLCNAAPSADCAPAVICLDGKCVIAAAGARKPKFRTVPAEKFFVGPGQTVLKPNELLVEIVLPPPEPNSAGVYERFTPRAEMDIAVAGVGSWVKLNGSVIEDVRICLAAVAPIPMRAKRAERALRGKEVSDKLIEQAAKRAAAECKPIDDVRGSAWYRRELVQVLTRRTLKVCLDQLR